MLRNAHKSVYNVDFDRIGDDNPIIIRSKILDEALVSILNAAIRVAKDNNFDQKETDQLINMIKHAYFNRKAKFFFGSKSHILSRTIQLMKESINDSTETEKFSKAYYYNKTMHSLKS